MQRYGEYLGGGNLVTVFVEKLYFYTGKLTKLPSKHAHT